MSNKEKVIQNLKSTIAKGGNEKMIASINRKLVSIEGDKQVNK